MIRLALVLSVLFTAAASAGEPVRVIDGDTLKLGSERVRLWGIDAPESRQTCRDARGVAFTCGQTAAAVLRGLIGQESPICEMVERDRFGRMVARCQVSGLDLGGAMVAAGWAVDFERYSGGRYQQEQETAKAAKRGLWAGRFIPPADWRKRH